MASLKRAQEYKNAGNIYFKRGKYDEAIAQYNKAIDICPSENVEDLAIFYQNRAAANEQLKKYSAVNADCTRALELNPRYAKAYLRRASALGQIGDLEAALKDTFRSSLFGGFSVQFDRVLEKLVHKHHLLEHLDMDEKFIMPSKHFIKTYIISFSKDPIFSKLQHPENIPEFFEKPLQALKDTEYNDIIPLCTEVIKTPEFDTLPSYKLEVLLLRATFYLLFGKHNCAFQDFKDILSSKDSSDDVRINTLIKRASLYMRLHKSEMAFEDYELAIRMNPSYSDIYHHRGQANLLMNKIDEAKCDFEKAVKYNPNFIMAYAQKCYTDYCFAMFNKDVVSTEAAVRDLERAFEKYLNPPEYTYCYILYAQMMSETRQYQKADTYFAKAIEVDPEHAVVYVHRGLLQLRWNGNVDKTIEYINKALELDEKCELAYESLGNIELQRGNIEEAIRLFDKALILCRAFMDTHIHNLREIAEMRLTIKKRLGKDVIGMSSQFIPMIQSMF